MKNTSKTSSKAGSRLRIISLFSGAGGLDLGFKQSGFRILNVAEINKDAIKTYNRNFSFDAVPVDLTDQKDYKLFVKKVGKKKVDLLIGGFPCQGYSMAGKRNVFDPRNQLYKKIVMFLNDFKPKYFLLENVPGILSMQKGETLKIITKFFNKNGWYFNYVVLNTSNFGVPQSRKRVIFIGSRKENNPETLAVLKSLRDTKEKIKNVRNAIWDLENTEENTLLNHTFTRHSNKIIKRISKVKPGESLYPSYSDGWRRVDYESVAPTVKENHGGVHIHPTKHRVLTPRELARLQTFPDNFIFCGSKKSQLVQIGNAVPVLFAKKIAEKIKEMLEKQSKN